MQFNHDNMTGVFLAADLVNASNPSAGWTAREAEELLRAHQIRRPALTAEAAAMLVEWAARLRTAFTAHDVPALCEAVNALLLQGTTRAYLTTHDQLRPHLHFAPDEDDVVARVKAVTAGGLAIFVTESQGARLGVCGRRGCETVFVDTSRNGLRAYCSARCGNTDAVRRHREKRPVDARSSA